MGAGHLCVNRSHYGVCLSGRHKRKTTLMRKYLLVFAAARYAGRMQKCIVTDAPITLENDSRAHVVPSALGGRLKPLGILCDEGNGELNDKIDLPLIRAFQPIMGLLGGSRDRGANPPIRMTDQAGKSYYVSFNQPLALAEPEYSVNSSGGVGEPIEIRIAARTRKEARTLLGRVKTAYPDFDVNEAMQQAAVVETQPTGMVGVQLQIGPAVVFPAAFAAASIFATFCKLQAHPDLQIYIANFDPLMIPPTLPPATFYWYPPEGFFDAQTTQVAHVIVLITDRLRKQALFHINYFDIACIAVLLPYDGDEDLAFSYAIDVTSGKQFEPVFDETKVRLASWAATHTVGESSLYEVTQARASRVIGISQERARSAAVGKIVDETLGPPDGRPLTQQDLDQLASRLTALIARQLR